MLVRAALGGLCWGGLCWGGVGCVPADDVARVHSVGQALRPDRPTDTELPPYFEPGATVLSHAPPSSAFRVHYTLQGPHRVPEADEDRDGVPDSVALVASEYDRVLAFFVEDLLLRPPRSDEPAAPDHGGDDRFDVYLLDFPNSADGAYRLQGCSSLASSSSDQLPGASADAGVPMPFSGCYGYMVQENDFAGRSYPDLRSAVRTLASHELFHAVQAAYALELSVVLSEGTATWASELYAPELSDFERASAGYLARTDRSLSLEPIGPVDAYSYGSALFFRFLQERYDQRLVGTLLERLSVALAGTWIEELDRLLRQDYDSSLSAAYRDHALWNLATGSRAGPPGSGIDGADEPFGYREAANYPEVGEEAVRLPHEEERMRVYPLSAHYFQAELAGATSVVLEVRLPDDADTDGTDSVDADEGGLSIALSFESPDHRLHWAGPLDMAARRSGSLQFEAPWGTGETGTVHAVVIGKNLTGRSLRPSLCFSPAMMGGCLDNATTMDTSSEESDGPLPEAGGAGLSDAMPERENAADEGDADTHGDGHGGCSVTTHSRSPVATVWPYFGLAIAFLLRGRRPW